MNRTSVINVTMSDPLISLFFIVTLVILWCHFVWQWNSFASYIRRLSKIIKWTDMLWRCRKDPWYATYHKRWKKKKKSMIRLSLCHWYSPYEWCSIYLSWLSASFIHVSTSLNLTCCITNKSVVCCHQC